MKLPAHALRNGLMFAFITTALSACVVNTQNANTQNASAGQAASGSHTILVAHQVHYNDPRSNDQLAALLPEGAFNQSEFPKSLVITMMRVCINKNHGNIASNPVAQAGKTDEFCSCKIDKNVHSFTLNEYMSAEKQNWDSSKAPAAAKKNSMLLTQCIQSALK